MGKYEEALERARQGLPIDEVFPELKDSEDERIRKILIHIVKGAFDKYGIKYRGDEISEEKILAYLEKQKEQKSTKWDNKDLPQGGEPIMINRILHSLRLYREMLKDSNFEEDYIKATLNNCLEDEKWLMSLEASQKPVE